jgi:alpha-galactosidase
MVARIRAGLDAGALARRAARLLLTTLFAAGVVLPLQGAAAPAQTALAAPASVSTPPMGFNDWNHFHCNVNEAVIEQTALAFVSSGMKAAGYQYVNIDDCWLSHSRDANGRLQADPAKFPHGIAAVASFVHAQGLKLGIYEDAGTMTCAKFPGSLGHETVDAQTFASWGVDYLKYDNCNNQGIPARTRYQAMANALKSVSRPIVYGICNWGQETPWIFGPAVGGNLWRTTGDINDTWARMLSIIHKQVPLAKFSHPGAWNDPDMLEVGNGHMSDTEYRTHFSMWALLNAPLLVGSDVRSMSAATRAILLNADVIAVDQDWGGMQGHRISASGSSEVWAKRMSDGSVAVALLNTGGGTATIKTTASAVGLPAKGSYQRRDLWSKATTTTGARISARVPSHGTVLLRVS